MYNFGKSNLKQDLKVFFKIDYEQKDEAKTEEYKFDAEKISWYKQYKSIDEFKNQSKFKYPPNRNLNKAEINQYILLKNQYHIINKNKYIIE